MKDQNILKIIDNLKGRKSYEQKKAAKLGFPSLYAYFEDKVLKQKNINVTHEKVLKKNANSDVVQKQEKKRCSCC